MAKKFLILLLIVLGISVVYQYYFSTCAILLIYVIHFLYLSFYTKQPKSFWLFASIGMIVSVYNLYYPEPILLFGFVVVVTLECIRVIVMAILRYPQTIRDLQSMTADLEKRVEKRTAELKETNDQLKKVNEELRQLDKMKTSFVSQASHDLRTPLAAIKGSLDNLSLGVAGELTEKQNKLLMRATRSVDRLTDLINDVLDLNRIETGRVHLEIGEIALRPIVENLVQENKTYANSKNITLKLDAPDEALVIHADPGKIERVVGELIGNAVKYSSEGGSIDVSIQHQENNAVLTVKDSGIGMSKEELNKIWDRFYRTPTSQNLARGSGLGLSITKELVEMHGGEIQVDSEQGKGSAFIVTLPLKKEEVG